MTTKPDTMKSKKRYKNKNKIKIFSSLILLTVIFITHAWIIKMEEIKSN